MPIEYKFKIYWNGEYRNISIINGFPLSIFFSSVFTYWGRKFCLSLRIGSEYLDFLPIGIPGELSKLQWVKGIKTPSQRNNIQSLSITRKWNAKKVSPSSLACIPVRHRESYSIFLHFSFFIFKIEILVITMYIPKSTMHKIIRYRKTNLL